MCSKRINETIPDMYEFKPDDYSTNQLNKARRIGSVITERFKNVYGEHALVEISKISKENPTEFSEIKGITESFAIQLRSHMIAGGVYVPQPGDVYAKNITTDLLLTASEKVYNQPLVNEVSKVCENLSIIGEEYDLVVNPQNTPELIAPVIMEAIGTVEFQDIPKKSRFTKYEFAEEVYKLLHELGIADTIDLSENSDYDPIKIANEDQIPFIIEGVEYVSKEIGFKSTYNYESQLRFVIKKKMDERGLDVEF